MHTEHRASSLLPLVLVAEDTPTGLRWGISGGWLDCTNWIGSYDAAVELAEDLLALRAAAGGEPLPPNVFLQGLTCDAEARVVRMLGVTP